MRPLRPEISAETVESLDYSHQEYEYLGVPNVLGTGPPAEYAGHVPGAGSAGHSESPAR